MSRPRYLADGVAVLVEEKVAMRRELAALVARSPFGQGAAWPVVQTVQRDGICVEVIAPAPGLAAELGSAAGATGAAAGRRTRGGRGAGRRAVRNRRRRAAGQRAGDAAAQLRALDAWTAPAPASSNSICARCWTIRWATPADRAGDGDGQCAWCARQVPSMSMDERLHHLFARMPEAKVHLYGKGERPGRKIGHVNVLGAHGGSLEDDAYVADVRERATRAAHWLSHAEWTDGWDEHG